MKEQQRSIYRSMQGREIDMNKFINQHEMSVAVGNMKVNARGDELGPGGRIIKKREDAIRENKIKVSSRPAKQVAEVPVDNKIQVVKSAPKVTRKKVSKEGEE